MTDAQRTVACPRCGAQMPYSAANPWRPFCGERCKLIDLGNWATERYRVPDPGNAAPEDEAPDTPAKPTGG